MTSRKKLDNVIRIIEKEAKSFPEVKSLIKFDGDDFYVDWEKVAEFQHRLGDGLGFFTSTVLLELGKLSWESKRNYELIRNGRSLNPYCAPDAYFGKKEDALAYREALIQDIGAKEERIFPIKLVQYLD